MARCLPAALALLAVAALLRPQAAAAETIQVTIKNLVFEPTEIHAKVGDTIEWINNDVFVHTATGRKGEFDVNIPAKKTVTQELKVAGDIAFYCRFHPNMTGRLVVGSKD